MHYNVKKTLLLLYFVTFHLNIVEAALNAALMFDVFVQNQISDYSTPIKTVLTYKMSDEHIQQPLSSIRDP